MEVKRSAGHPRRPPTARVATWLGLFLGFALAAVLVTTAAGALGILLLLVALASAMLLWVGLAKLWSRSQRNRLAAASEGPGPRGEYAAADQPLTAIGQTVLARRSARAAGVAGGTGRQLVAFGVEPLSAIDGALDSTFVTFPDVTRRPLRLQSTGSLFTRRLVIVRLPRPVPECLLRVRTTVGRLEDLHAPEMIRSTEPRLGHAWLMWSPEHMQQAAQHDPGIVAAALLMTPPSMARVLPEHSRLWAGSLPHELQPHVRHVGRFEPEIEFFDNWCVLSGRYSGTSFPRPGAARTGWLATDPRDHLIPLGTYFATLFAHLR